MKKQQGNEKDRAAFQNKSENKKARVGAQKKSENKKAGTGTQKRPRNEKAGTGTQKKSENKRAGTGTQKRPRNEKAGTGFAKMPNNAEEAAFVAKNEKATAETTTDIIVGRNPVMEALKSGREIEKIMIATGAEGSIKKIEGMAKDKGIPFTFVERSVIDRVAGGSAHQGVAAQISAYGYVELDDILEAAENKGEPPFIIILDGIEDPHNLGAIMRSAEAAGVHGIVIPKRRAVGITETVVKASAGAVEYIPVAKVSNIAQTIEELKKKNIWIAACDMGGENYYNANLTGGIAVVIGAEGAGVSRLVRESCDFVVSMPMLGKINSLNASNAAAIIIYEVRRQRLAGEKKKGEI